MSSNLKGGSTILLLPQRARERSRAVAWAAGQETFNGGCFYCHRRNYQGKNGLNGILAGVRRADFSHLFAYMEEAPDALDCPVSK